MERRDSLYCWQEECLRRWLFCHGRGIAEAVTGSGKTRLALEACRRLDELCAGDGEKSSRLRIKVVVPTSALMRQWSRALREFLEKQGEQADIGLCGGGVSPKAEKKYMIYVVNSARYTLARAILADLKRGDPVFLIADECHHYTSGENRLLFEFRSYIEKEEENYFALGLSATLPLGEDRRFLEYSLGKVIYRYGLKKALLAQTVCRYDIFSVELEFCQTERDEYDELSMRMNRLMTRILSFRPELRELDRKEFFGELRRLAGNRTGVGSKEAKTYLRLALGRRKIVCLAKAREECAIQLIRLLGVRNKIIVFGERISQMEELYGKLLRLFPGKVGRCHSGAGERANKNALERFRTGETRILLSCKSLDEGIDIPEVSVGVILSGTSGMRQRVQRLGRIVRRAEGKERASLYYLHIADSSEERCYLPGGGESRIFELKYCPEPENADFRTGPFRSPEYDRAAELVWESLQKSDVSAQRDPEPDPGYRAKQEAEPHPGYKAEQRPELHPGFRAGQRPELYPEAQAGRKAALHQKYKEEQNSESCPGYRADQEQALRPGREPDNDAKIRREYQYCMALGSIRTDWREPPEEMNRRLAAARTVRDKNYWICMKKLSEAVQNGSGQIL